MLVISRKANEEGREGSTFTVGDTSVTVLRVFDRDVRIQLTSGKGLRRVEYVPFGRLVELEEGFSLLLRHTGALQYGSRQVRVGIEAPKTMRILRDDIIDVREAA